MASSGIESKRYSVILEPKWRRRFKFYDAHGAPYSSEVGEVLKRAPWEGGFLIRLNWLGLFLGPIYFVALGMWRRALTLLAIVYLSAVLPSVVAVLIYHEPLELTIRAIMLGSSGFGVVAFEVGDAWGILRLPTFS
ncbi:MAG: DUF2628 domain-containing protein [Phycisphaerales bacterium]|nr:DUF2628 domain-containing protein [Phycisphaerales bacterium]